MYLSVPHHPLPPHRRGPMKTPTKDEILATLRQHKPFLQRSCGVQRIALFGSALRNELTPESDIDILVELGPPPTDSFDQYFSIMHYLEDHLGRTVDLVEREQIRPEARHEIETTAHYV